MKSIETIELVNMEAVECADQITENIAGTELSLNSQPNVNQDLTYYTGTNLHVNVSGEVNIGNTYINNISSQNVVTDLPITKYLWKTTIMNSSKMERVMCALVSIAVLFSISTVVYYFLFIAHKVNVVEEFSDWFVSRDQWTALPYDENIPLRFHPIQLVVVQHTVSRPCYDFVECSIAVLGMQETYLAHYRHSDLPYNFLVGNDGRVYEGRGWGVESVSSRWLNRCLISIGFIGDYRNIQPTDLQLNNTKKLLAIGVKEKHLNSNYSLLGAIDLLATQSPGHYLYEAIQQFEQYERNNKFRYMACEQIHESEDNPFVDEAPHEWLIAREDWGAQPLYNFTSTKRYDPLQLVIINHFTSRNCHVYSICRSQMRNLHGNYLLSYTDIPFNFMIGNDGRVYEARGWGVEGGDSNLQFQPCAVNIGFFGNYAEGTPTPTHTRVTPAQINRTQMLLKEGVSSMHLHQKYLLVGASNFLHTASPGQNILEEIKTWEHYYDGDLKTKTCDTLPVY